MASSTLKRDLTEFTSLREAAAGAPRVHRGPRGMSQFKGVTIIKAGLGNHRDKNYYPAETLESAVKAGYFNGLRAYADHQDSLSEEVQPERTIRDMVGVYLRPRFVREGKQGGRVVADLNLFRSSKWLSDTVDDLIELGQADRIGLSINGRGRTVERQVQLEESADPINVNWVEDFLVLRSADVVTEAGAGGGFQQLLESARGSVKAKEKEMAKPLTEQQKRDIKAAADAGDVDKLAALMKECGCMEAAPKGDKAKSTGKVTAEAEDPEEADADGEDADATTEADTEAEVDAEAERIKAEAEGEDPDAEDVSEGEDPEDADEEGTDAEEAEDDGEDGEPTREAGPYKGNGMPKGAGVLIRGKKGGGLHNKIKGDKDSLRSAVRPGRQTAGLQKGRRYAESADLQTLKRQNERLREENARLVTQLRVRTTTDRARNLIRESAIPGKMQPEVLRLMVGKSEDEMRRIIRYHERLIESAVEEREDSFVEGAGSRFRESYHGGGRGDDVSSILSEVGVPLRSK